MQTDLLHREVCCLPRARIRDVKRKLLALVWPSDYYLSVIFHVHRDEASRPSLRTIKRDFRAL